jgi:putative addiction module component (TIGR02574 family)
MSVILEEVNKLPIPERVKLVEHIWETIESEARPVELSAVQLAELKARIDYAERNPNSGVPWETIRDEALARLK